MKTNPPKGITIKASIALAAFAFASLCFGWFTLAGILGTCAAINLIAGNLLKKY